ncbi:MAG TPA: ABC transporter permease [Candidatus Limnocylindria bacterium]|jgi:peptide/nickel transport system permease protein|nr:ABC transporter permease [Candidatus Limnocylindria bacterium]
MSRGRWILRRIALAVPVLFGITVLTFVLVRMTPGDPVLYLVDPAAMSGAPEEYIAARRSELGLDKPTPVQYAVWIRELGQGNLGYSFVNRRPVTKMIAERVEPTVRLMGTALLFALLIGIPTGVVAALRQYSLIDYVVAVLSLTVISTPAFFLALGAIYVFSLRLDLTPIGGMATIGRPADLVDALRHLILPAGILGLSLTGPIVRYTRASVLEVLSQEYLSTARAKGLRERVVIVRHALPNALIPIISVVGVMIPLLFGGSVIVEQIFSWPGMGQLILAAIGQRDYPVLMGITMVVAILVLACSVLTDIAYTLVDPRIRLG